MTKPALTKPASTKPASTKPALTKDDATRLIGALVAAGIAAAAPSAQAATTLAGNVAPWAATAPRAGTSAADQQVSIVVHLALKDTATLKQVVAAVSKPGSKQYGKYLDVASFRARFAPDANDVAAVQSMLRNAGMSRIETGPGGVYVAARATVAQLRATFGVSQDSYRVGGRTLRANREAPSLPAALAGKVVYIEGLDDATYLKHPMHQSAVQGALAAPASRGAAPAVTPPPVAANAPSPYCDHYFGDLKGTLSTKPNPYPQTLPWIGCGYTPQQVQAAYGMDKVALDGTGITIAITDAYASPTLRSDGNQYAANHNLPPLSDRNFSQIIPDGIYDVDPSETCGPYGWWGEQSLDVAAVHGSAPGAKILYVGARDCGSSLSTALENTIYNHQADVITNSYGFNGEADDPADIVAQDQAFMAAAAMGITVLFSSGDEGDLSQANGVATGAYASTSPYVTAVGGTTLGLRSAAGDKGEWGWGTYRDYLGDALVNSGTSVTTSGLALTSAFGSVFNAFTYYGGAGGGISLVEPQPDYQAGIVPATLATTVYYAGGNSVGLQQPQRVAPDVAMLADPYTGYLVGESFTAAGDPVNDTGCTPKAKNKSEEYCEIAFGGTSLASPLMAGVIAIVNQQRVASGLPLVGFANPWLYGAKIGKSFTARGINDVLPPASPMGMLRGYVTDPTRIRLITINSVSTLIDTVPFPLTVCAAKVCEGLNDVFNYVTPGYDNVTGLGVPYVPALITQ